MRVGAWLVSLAVLGCVGARVADQPSPAGLTTIVVRGQATNVVLVDPHGRINRSSAVKNGEIAIPECNRWDGGTETTLDDSSAADDQAQGDVVTQLELTPIIGRYRLYAETTDDGSTSVTVTPVRATGVYHACGDLTRDIQKRKGRFVWNIEFLADTGRTACPVRLSGPFRTSSKK